jgi:hypothetical protein
MRYLIGFTNNVTDRPFYTTEVQGSVPAFIAGQLVSVPQANTGWLQILQVGTMVVGDQMRTTILVGPVQPAGSLSSGSVIWPEEAVDWDDIST